MSTPEQEMDVLNSIVPKLQAEGYAVHVHPPRSMLPSFMQSYTPDAIALGVPKNLAIEVVLEGPSTRALLSNLRERFEHSRDWDLRVYYAHPSDERGSLEVVSKAEIDGSLATVGKLIELGERKAALLMSWASFEAIGRALLPKRFVRPQSPGRLIEVLATDGQLLPNEADTLRRLADLRNRLIHGKLDLDVPVEDLGKFIDILNSLAMRLSRSRSQSLS